MYDGEKKTMNQMWMLGRKIGMKGESILREVLVDIAIVRHHKQELVISIFFYFFIFLFYLPTYVEYCTVRLIHYLVSNSSLLRYPFVIRTCEIHYLFIVFFFLFLLFLYGEFFRWILAFTCMLIICVCMYIHT